jgi:hypothetical protein
MSFFILTELFLVMLNKVATLPGEKRIHKTENGSKETNHEIISEIQTGETER